LASQRQDLLNNDDEDDLALRNLIDNLRLENGIPNRRGLGGSRPGKRANINTAHKDGH
jgi:hypothetical protein